MAKCTACSKESISVNPQQPWVCDRCHFQNNTGWNVFHDHANPAQTYRTRRPIGTYEQTDGYGSEAEEAGIKFQPSAGTFGKGAYDRARQSSVPNRLILSPQNNCNATDFSSSFDHAIRKQSYFQAVYPQYGSSTLYTPPEPVKDYRLILPLFPGKRFDYFFSQLEPTPQQRLYLSLIRELKRIHALGITLVDIKGDNVLVDGMTNEIYLIDGGLHLSSKFPMARDYELSEAEKTKMINNCYHIAPEYWERGPYKNPEKMDVFSLAILNIAFKRCKSFTWPLDLFLQCTDANPNKRPTLAEIEDRLSSVVVERQVVAPKTLYNLQCHRCSKGFQRPKNELVSSQRFRLCHNCLPVRRQQTKRGAAAQAAAGSARAEALLPKKNKAACFFCGTSVQALFEMPNFTEIHACRGCLSEWQALYT